MQLCQGVLRYYAVSLFDLLHHVFNNYAKIDNRLVLKNKKQFEEPPYLTRPIGVYFRKQEECQKLAAYGGVPIVKAEMIVQLQTHLGTTEMINTKYLVWKKKTLPELNCKGGNNYFRLVINNVEDINKLTMGEAGLTVNATIKKQDSEQKVRK